jgi:hypothetical protein
MSPVLIICIVIGILLWITTTSSIILAYNHLRLIGKNHDILIQIHEIYRNNLHHKDFLISDICRQLGEILSSSDVVYKE